MSGQKNPLKNSKVFLPVTSDTKLATKQSLTCMSLLQKKENLSVIENSSKMFDNIHRICMSREETFGGAN